MAWGHCLHCLDKRNTYVRMLFIDYSSAFHNIVPSKVITKLRTLGLNTSAMFRYYLLVMGGVMETLYQLHFSNRCRYHICLNEWYCWYCGDFTSTAFWIGDNFFLIVLIEAGTSALRVGKQGQGVSVLINKWNNKHVTQTTHRHGNSQ
jgi:hypothetical protein